MDGGISRSFYLRGLLDEHGIDWEPGWRKLSLRGTSANPPAYKSGTASPQTSSARGSKIGEIVTNRVTFFICRPLASSAGMRALT
jgi:hypothetical protein